MLGGAQRLTERLLGIAAEPDPVPQATVAMHVMPEFAVSEPDAESRYKDWRSRDPFPAVAPALLNSADLLDYIATAGILYPFTIPEGKVSDWVKSASCALPCAGDFLRYDLVTDGPMKAVELRGSVSREERLQLPPNSITYLRLNTTFRLPNYLAARFNLTIREIHRGILVGTGPLVDPGFVGQLLIPLHNLTNNPYTVAFGEPLVWVEFTKLSQNTAWDRGAEPRRASLVEFPSRKNADRSTTAAYLDHANEGKPIMSSLRPIDERTKRTERVVRDTRRFSVGVAVAVIALIATLFAGAVGAFVYTLTYTDGRVGNVDHVQRELRTFEHYVCGKLTPAQQKALRC